jgi:hypothetical protein
MPHRAERPGAGPTVRLTGGAAPRRDAISDGLAGIGAFLATTRLCTALRSSSRTYPALPRRADSCGCPASSVSPPACPSAGASRPVRPPAAALRASSVAQASGSRPPTLPAKKDAFGLPDGFSLLCRCPALVNAPTLPSGRGARMGSSRRCQSVRHEWAPASAWCWRSRTGCRWVRSCQPRSRPPDGHAPCRAH